MKELNGYADTLQKIELEPPRPIQHVVIHIRTDMYSTSATDVTGSTSFGTTVFW